MKKFLLFLGIVIILGAVSFIALQNYDYVKPIILTVRNSSSSVAIPIVCLFIGIFLVIIGISPSNQYKGVA